MNNYKKVILDNGIPLYIYNDPTLKQVYFGCVIEYGSSGRFSKFNLDGQDYSVRPGCAHFLEHLLGERSKYGNIYTNFNLRCYDYDAYTAVDHTCYDFCGVIDVKQSIKELIEAIEEPVFDEQDVEDTKCAIEEEASMQLDAYNQIAAKVAENILFSGYREYDKSYSDIGTRANNRKMDIDTLRTCYKAFYKDENKKLILAGNINEQEMVDYINGIYARIPRHTSSLILPSYDLEGIEKKHQSITRSINIDINSFAFKIKKPDELSKRDVQFCMDIFAEYLFGELSKFAIDTRKRKLVDGLKASYSLWVENYLKYVQSYISQKSDKYFNRILDVTRKKDISKEEFELIKKLLLAEIVRELDFKYSMLDDFGRKTRYTEDFSDLDYVSGINYDKFREMLGLLDFSQYTTGEIKKKIK